jgi:enoyl-CoA hydratase
MLKTERQGDIEIWTIDRPETRNALDYATMTALMARVHALEDDQTVRGAIITGAGEMFVSGGDLNELREMTTPDQATRFCDVGYELTTRMEDLQVPIICAMPGPAIGGGAELAIACDLRIMDERGAMSFRHVKMGLTTAWGTAARLISLCGPSTTMRILLRAEDVHAKDAHALGLVDAVTPIGRAFDTAMAWMQDIVRSGPHAIEQMKSLIVHTRREASRAREIEREKFLGTWQGKEHVAAMEAFFAKRAARSIDRSG